MFEKASRLKLRFDTARGGISVEDLWDLPLTSGTGKVNLDDIAKGLYREIKDTSDVLSFVDDSTTADNVLQIKFDLIKHVINVKKAEAKAAADARSNRERNQKILGIIAEKEDEGLKNLSIDELKALAASNA
jgi:hypothetical protein